MNTFTDLQLDALRELANIGSGTAGTALGQMLGARRHLASRRPPCCRWPRPSTSPASPTSCATASSCRSSATCDAIVLLLFPDADARTLCGIYGVEPATPDGESMLGEIGNILGTSYINVLAQMTGLELEPAPPQVVEDMLGAIVASVLLGRGEDVDVALHPRLRPQRRGRGVLALVPAAARPTAAIRQLLERLGL